MIQDYHGAHCSDEALEYAQEYQNIFRDSVFVVNGFPLSTRKAIKVIRLIIKKYILNITSPKNIVP